MKLDRETMGTDNYLFMFIVNRFSHFFSLCVCVCVKLNNNNFSGEFDMF